MINVCRNVNKEEKGILDNEMENVPSLVVTTRQYDPIQSVVSVT